MICFIRSPGDDFFSIRYIYFLDIYWPDYTLVPPCWVRTVKSLYSKTQEVLVARLKSARIKSGLTQLQVAKKFKKPQSFIARLESGQRRIDVVELKVLADLYGCALTSLLPK